MMQKRWLIALCAVPVVGMAQNYGGEIDALLADFYGENATQLTSVRNFEGDAPAPDFSFEAEQNAQSSITQQIETETQKYDALLQQANAVSQQIWSVHSRRTSAATQLQALDADIGIQTSALRVLQRQEVQWQQELENLTKELYTARAATRAETTALVRDVQLAYVRTYSASSNANWVAMRWLLGRQTAAQIQEGRRLTEIINDNRRTRIAALQSLSGQLSTAERDAALTRARLGRLRTEREQKQFSLKQLADAKANLLSDLEIDEEALRDRYAQYENQLYTSRQTLTQLQQSYADSAQNRFVAPRPVAETGLTADEQIEVAGRFQSPLRGALRVTAPFRDGAYRSAFGREHDGVDFAAAQGSDVLAAADGAIAAAEDNGLGYSFVIVQHADGWFTVYGHLSEILVVEGQRVVAGDMIARSGGTPGTPGAGSMTTGPHLHFELAKDGEYADPLLLLQ